MPTSLKTGFAQIFSCYPKNLGCPKFGGTAAPLAPPTRTPMEQETDHVLPFLDGLINDTDPHQSVTTVYWKKTFTGLLTSYLSFCPFTYKLGLIKTLIHITFEINNTCMGFHTDLQKLSVIRPPETFVFPISWFSSLFSKSGRRNIVR